MCSRFVLTREMCEAVARFGVGYLRGLVDWDPRLGAGRAGVGRSRMWKRSRGSVTLPPTWSGASGRFKISKGGRCARSTVNDRRSQTAATAEMAGARRLSGVATTTRDGARMRFAATMTDTRDACSTGAAAGNPDRIGVNMLALQSERILVQYRADAGGGCGGGGGHGEGTGFLLVWGGAIGRHGRGQ